MTVYLSEIKFENSNDFVEVVATDGEDLSGYSIAAYDSNGNLKYMHSLAGEYFGTTAGNDGYLVDRADGLPDMGNNWAVALIDDQGTVVQFISDHSSAITAVDGPAAGSTSTNLGNIASGGESVETSDGGSTYSVQSSPNPGTIPCFAKGTMIDTPDGPRAVETLQKGDLVETLDHGTQAIRWTSYITHPLEDSDSDAKPLRIKAGALGRNLPVRDLIVSQQHRILAGGAGQLQQVFASEVFAPAKSLTAVPGIRYMKGKKEITWIHFACDRHEIVFANGCLSESLLLGPMVVNGLTAAERQAVTDIFGSALTPDAALNGPPARECLTVGEVRRQLAKCSEDKEKLVAKEIRKWDVDLAMEQYEAERLREAKAMSQSPIESAANTEGAIHADSWIKSSMASGKRCRTSV